MTVKPVPIWTLKNPQQAGRLRAVAAPIALDQIKATSFKRLIRQMVATMQQAHGVGLAAPQIGQPIRLAVVAASAADNNQPLILINPVLSNFSTQQETVEEGCLSIPGVFGLVPRAWSLTLTALDSRGQTFTRPAEGFLARVLQHEVDHLNGTLFIDRTTSITHGHHLL